MVTSQLSRTKPLNAISRVRYWLELLRLRVHFIRVVHLLQNQDVSHLSGELQAARKQYLILVEKYGHSGVFPRNYHHRGRVPVFVDQDGRLCAVAHLLSESGRADIVNKIRGEANFAIVPDMKFSELAEWAKTTGLSQEDLALIQPMYGDIFYYYHVYTPQIWMSGLTLLPLIVALWQLLRKGNRVVLGILAAMCIVLGTQLFLTALQLNNVAQDVVEEYSEYCHETIYNGQQAIVCSGYYAPHFLIRVYPLYPFVNEPYIELRHFMGSGVLNRLMQMGLILGGVSVIVAVICVYSVVVRTIHTKRKGDLLASEVSNIPTQPD